MTHNQTKIDETVLATLLLTLHEENRVWKGHSFEVLAKAREVFDGLFILELDTVLHRHKIDR